jgi:hypothetical protein
MAALVGALVSTYGIWFKSFPKQRLSGRRTKNAGEAVVRMKKIGSSSKDIG